MNRTKLICPLTSSDVAAMRRDMDAAASRGADVVELRLDFLAAPPTEADLRRLLARPRPPAIVTYRPRREGGRHEGDETARLHTLQLASELGAEWLDIEMDVPAASRPRGARIILSHHDFGRCPPDLDGIFASLRGERPAVAKVAFAASGPEDAFRALDQIHACEGPTEPGRVAPVASKPGTASERVAPVAPKPGTASERVAPVAPKPGTASERVAPVASVRGTADNANAPSPGDTVALAMGEPGVPSRILAAKFGAFGTFAALSHGAESAPGQPALEEMRSLYRWDRVGPATAVFGVVGCPVAHSMSPAIHNAAFSAAGVDGVYLPLLVQPGAGAFGRLMDGILGRPWLGWRGLSVTIPHKENALAYVGAGRCEELARRIGAINTITLGPGGQLRGDNTDYAAAMDALCAGMAKTRDAPGFPAGGKHWVGEGIHSSGREPGRVPGFGGRGVALLGAGGVARAILAALRHHGADVTVYNRTLERAAKLAEEFGARAAGADRLDAIDQEIVINCTSVGMHPHVEQSPLPAIPPAVRVVFETIYNPVETLLLRQARQAGCTCISGLEMFVNQGVAQFEIWTGRAAPRDVMRRVVMDRLGAK